MILFNIFYDILCLYVFKILVVYEVCNLDMFKFRYNQIWILAIIRFILCIGSCRIGNPNLRIVWSDSSIESSNVKNLFVIVYHGLNFKPPREKSIKVIMGMEKWSD